MDVKMLEGLMKGEAQALEEISDLLRQATPHQESITKLWTVLVHGMKINWHTGRYMERSRQIDFALELGKVEQDQTVLERFGDLALMFGFPHSDEAIEATSRTSSRISGLVEKPKDGDGYLVLAMDSLLMMLDEGDDECKKHAAAGLAYLPNPEVKARLIAMAQQSPSNELRAAAGESVGQMRTMTELSLAQSDRKMFLAIEYPNAHDYRREMLEQMLDAAILVLSTNGEGQGEDYAVAVRELSTFASFPDDLSIAFYSKRDRLVLEKVMVHCENALLRALVKSNDPSVREDAAGGLEDRASERIENVLESITNREGERQETRERASETLARVRGKNVEILSSAPDDGATATVPNIQPPPRPPPRRNGGETSNPGQALKIKM